MAADAIFLRQQTQYFSHFSTNFDEIWFGGTEKHAQFKNPKPEVARRSKMAADAIYLTQQTP